MMISAAPEEPLAPIWTVVAAAVPATITLAGTLAKLNAQRPLQTSPVRIDDPSPRLLRLIVHRPEWSIQPRFAVKMIVWHIAVAGALFLIWSKPEVVGLSSLSFLVPLAAIYAGAALYYAWALWKLRGVDLSARAELVVESDLATFEKRLLASMESSRSKLIIFKL